MSADYPHNSTAYNPLQRGLCLVIITNKALGSHYKAYIRPTVMHYVHFFFLDSSPLVTRELRNEARNATVKSREDLRPSASATGPSFGQWPREREKQAIGRPIRPCNRHSPGAGGGIKSAKVAPTPYVYYPPATELL